MHKFTTPTQREESAGSAAISKPAGMVKTTFLKGSSALSFCSTLKRKMELAAGEGSANSIPNNGEKVRAEAGERKTGFIIRLKKDKNRIEDLRKNFFQHLF